MLYPLQEMMTPFPSPLFPKTQWQPHTLFDRILIYFSSQMYETQSSAAEIFLIISIYY